MAASTAMPSWRTNSSRSRLAPSAALSSRIAHSSQPAADMRFTGASAIASAIARASGSRKKMASTALASITTAGPCAPASARQAQEIVEEPVLAPLPRRG